MWNQAVARLARQCASRRGGLEVEEKAEARGLIRVVRCIGVRLSVAVVGIVARRVARRVMIVSAVLPMIIVVPAIIVTRLVIPVVIPAVAAAIVVFAAAAVVLIDLRL